MHGLSIIVVLISIILTAFTSYAIVGKLLLWGTVFVQLILQKVNNSRTSKTYNSTNIGIVCLLLGWMLIRAQNMFGLHNFILFLLLMLCYVSTIRFKSISKGWLSIIFALVIVFSFVFHVLGEDCINGNIGGLIASIISVIMYIYFPKKRFIITVLALTIVFIYGSRSVILSFVLSLIVFLSVRRLNIKLGYIVVFLAIVIGVGLYSYWDFIMSTDFNAIVLEKTGKNFQSGRNLIWGAIFDYMKGSDWLFGAGGGVNHKDIVPAHYSSLSLHSSYVFMIFHYGIVGLGLLWTLFYRILKQMLRKGYTYSVILLLFFIIRDFFEITLVNNQMAIAFLFWAWIANGGADKLANAKIRRIQDNASNKMITFKTLLS